jgi:hypothetical protein
MGRMHMILCVFLIGCRRLCMLQMDSITPQAPQTEVKISEPGRYPWKSNERMTQELQQELRKCG